MRFPWANTLLLALIAVELVSGFFGLVSGSPDEAIFILVHRIAGWGIVTVLAWKAANVLASLRWPRAATPRTASLVLGARADGDSAARLRMVLRRSDIILALQWCQLAHLHRRRARPYPDLACHLPYARLPAALLGGKAFFSSLGRAGDCRRSAVARRRSCGKCGRIKRSDSTVHRLVRSRQLHGKRLPANIVAKRQSGSYQPNRMEAQNRRCSSESNETPIRRDCVRRRNHGNAGLHGRMALNSGVARNRTRRSAGNGAA